MPKTEHSGKTSYRLEPSKRRTLPHNAEIISIPPQKKVMREGLGGIIIVLAILIAFAYYFDEFQNPELILVFLFCLMVCLYLATKIKQLKYSLIINKEGIIDHHNFYGLGFIPWEQVGKITFEERENRSYHGFYLGTYYVINILVRDPEKILQEQKKRWYNFFLRFRFNILLTESDVACDHYELYELLLARLQKHRKANSNRQIRASL